MQFIDSEAEFQRAAYRHLKHIYVPRMTTDERRKFVIDYLAGRIFTSHGVPEGSLPMVFMPVAFGCFEGWERSDFEKLGVIFEYVEKAGPRSINGLPVFFSLQLMHIADWTRCADAINRELVRQQEIEV